MVFWIMSSNLGYLAILLVILCLPEFACNKPSGGLDRLEGIYHQAKGNGTPVLFIHGGPGLGSTYLEKHFEELNQDFRIIHYDQRNSGRSKLTMDSTKISLDEFLKDIDALRQFYNCEQLALISHSWGGLIAMQYALQYPHRVSHLILINSVTANSDINAQANTRLVNSFSTDDLEARTQIMRTAAFRNENPLAYEELMLIGFSYQFSNRNFVRELKLGLPDDFGKKSSQLRYLSQDLGTFNFTDDLQQLTVPTMMLYGLDDPLTSFAINNLAPAIPNTTVQVIDHAGHFPFIENEEEVLSAIREFLQ